MEPQIRYTTTSDGVNIAWGEAGQGPALLSLGPTPFTHVQEHFALWESYFGTLARSFRLITFDARGTGMSERAVGEVSLDTMLLDAQAVAEAANLETFAVEAEAFLLSFATALNLATSMPERVTHIVLEAPFQNMRELADTPFGRVSLTLAEADWSVYVQTLHRVLSGWDSADYKNVEALTKLAIQWVDADVGRKYIRALYEIDLGSVLDQVRQPTLIVRNEPFLIPAVSCQRIASKIPGARLHQFADPTYHEQARVICEFIGLPEPSDSPEAYPATALRTVLFTDLVGHTEMMSRLGDERGRDVLREHERITRDVLKANGGTELKTMGDGFMASFGSVTKAVECAVALQRAFADRAGEPLSVRVGLNAGEPIEEDGDLFGATVILASRIAAKADGGEILVADTVRGLCSGKGFLFADRGEFVAKGFEEPVRISEVRWAESPVTRSLLSFAT
jgi:class 3 adenylate cyclase/pimeloyl-ACP methyl ester carboxylesterase